MPNIHRRDFLKTTGWGLGTLALGSAKTAAAAGGAVKVGMCDWNLGPSCSPELIPRAREAQLDGLQVSVGVDPGRIPLREPEVRETYLRLGLEHGIQFHSVAAGSILNRIPLKSEPQSAVYVIDAVEAAAALGASNILVAFFGNGDLRLRDADGEFRNLGSGPFHFYELDTVGVKRVIEALRQIAPRAEAHNVILGLENTLTAEQNLEIIDGIGSRMVQVYYDVGNSTNNGYDVPSEIRLLGNDRICEIHVKDRGSRLLGTPEGVVDFGSIADACRDIGYDNWYVLETSGRENRFVEDTRANVAFVKRMFG